MSVKNYLEEVFVCVFADLNTHSSFHYWPAAEASHFPVFIKTRPIKFYLQSIIRTPQINQRQLNQCFPGLVFGARGPHGHSIFTAGLIHGMQQWSHAVHSLAYSWLLGITVPWSRLWSAPHGGSPLWSIQFDFINSPVEFREEKMNTMFHFVLSGYMGLCGGDLWLLWHKERRR